MRYISMPLDAISREKELKKWRREKKINLIKTINPTMKDLSQELFNDFDMSDEEIKEYVSEFKEAIKDFSSDKKSESK